jgi:hypothetical protein
MTDENLFDAAWDQWRWDVTHAIMSSMPAGEAAWLFRIFYQVGALHPDDKYLRREWGLGLLSGATAVVDPLQMAGVTDDQLRALVVLIQRHPIPAAGG